MRMILVAAVALGALSTAAWAEPVKLSNSTLDGVTAGSYVGGYSYLPTPRKDGKLVRYAPRGGKKIYVSQNAHVTDISAANNHTNAVALGHCYYCATHANAYGFAKAYNNTYVHQNVGGY